MQNLVDVQDLQVCFKNSGKELAAVDHISFTVGSQETLGIVGESGCGKSMTSLSLMGLVPKNGLVRAKHIWFQGEDLLEKSGDEMRQLRGDQMAMIFQEPMTSLNPVLTIGFQMSEVLTVHRGITRQEAEKQSLAMLERVGIARALCLNPKLIVCDEPVSALDVSIQSQILNLLEDLQDRFHLTYLFIAHGLTVVKHISDRIGVMYLGKLIELADSSELFARPLHPYTEALLSAIPATDPSQRRQRILLEGDVPNAMNLPSGCRFHTRCPYCQAVCREQEPELKEMGNGHFCACHFSEKR